MFLRSLPFSFPSFATTSHSLNASLTPSHPSIHPLSRFVTKQDLFQSTVGPTKDCSLTYDRNGKHKGVATVVFQRRGDAQKAFKTCESLFFRSVCLLGLSTGLPRRRDALAASMSTFDASESKQKLTPSFPSLSFHRAHLTSRFERQRTTHRWTLVYSTF